jgi:hypothetical protein
MAWEKGCPADRDDTAPAQVIAQYGPDSNAVQLVGRKRKSERKRPVRRAAVAMS